MLTGLKKQEESSQNHVRELDIVQRSRKMFVWLWPIYAGVNFHDAHYIFTPTFFCFFFLQIGLKFSVILILACILHFILFHLALKIKINMMVFSTAYYITLSGNA